MAFSRLPVFAYLAALASAAGTCQNYTLDFILLQGDTLSAQIEDDIRADLALLNIAVNTRLLAKADFNTAMTSGDYNLCFTETWGPPYDPHSYAASWFVSDEAHYPALDGLSAPVTKTVLQQKVTAVLNVESLTTRQTKWTEILQAMHTQAISNPMWSRTMPAVINRRLSGYLPGVQQFDYPMHLINVVSGSTSITVSAGAQTGLFGSSNTTVPDNHPHGYRPNEFFINNWIYEGLVSYGQDGMILPQLAVSWTVTATSGGGQEYRFTLRANVKFHDGSACDCAAIKMTFDHVLQPPLNTSKHNWYLLPANLQSWECQGQVFVAKLSQVYYPFLQELSFIRPIRVLSPNCYASGASSSPVLNNSCPTGWNADVSGIYCSGVQCVMGTGPWKYVDRTLTTDGSVEQMRFTKNDDWWGIRGDVTEIILKGFTTANAVQAALLSSSLDMVVGGGALTPVQVRSFEQTHATTFQVLHGPALMNTIIVMNAARAPTNNIQLRKVIMHGVNKAAIVNSELAGSSVVADSLFPKATPYCNVDLTPRWDYDFEKAQLLNCPAATVVTDQGEKDDDTGLIVGLTLGIGIPLLVGIGLASFFFGMRSGYSRFSEEESSRKQAAANPPSLVGASESGAADNVI